MSAEQMPLFEVATEPLSETEDVPTPPRGFISWAELQREWGYEPEQFDQTEETMSPIEIEESE